MRAISLLEVSADPSNRDPSLDRNSGYHPSAILASEYYLSDGFQLPPGKITENEENMKKAIEYQELALEIIRSRHNYPSGNDFILEKRNLLHLSTVSNLIEIYIDQFIIKMRSHYAAGNTGIPQSAIESLQNAIETTERCIQIPKNTDVWDEDVYNAVIDLCKKQKELPQELLHLVVVHNEQLKTLHSDPVEEKETYSKATAIQMIRFREEKQKKTNIAYSDLHDLLRFSGVRFGL